MEVDWSFDLDHRRIILIGQPMRIGRISHGWDGAIVGSADKWETPRANIRKFRGGWILNMALFGRQQFLHESKRKDGCVTDHLDWASLAWLGQRNRWLC